MDRQWQAGAIAQMDKPIAAVERRPLRFIDAALYGIVLIVGPNWIAVAGAAGPPALPLWLLALAVFFVPLAVASAELTQRFAAEGGIYLWTRETLGPLAGFLCGWSYWTSLMPAYASMLFFTSGLIVRLTGADPHDTHLYLAISLSIAAVVVGIELTGFKYGKWVTNLGAAGTWIVFALIVGIAAVLLGRGAPATDFRHASYLPPMSFDTTILWGTMVFAFSGAESVGFLRNEIAGGMRTVTRVLVAIGISVALIYIVGTVAFLVVLPKAELTRLSGFADALTSGLNLVGARALAPLAIGVLAMSYLGGFAGWFGVGARLPFAAGIDHFLPPLFAHRHPKTGAPVAAILLQGAMIIVFVVLSQAGETASGTYDLLVAMSVLMAALPYVFLFAAYGMVSRGKPLQGAWRPPGGARTSRALAAMGLGGTLAAIGCSLVPGGHDPLAGFLKIFLSASVMMLVGAVVYGLARRRVATI